MSSFMSQAKQKWSTLMGEEPQQDDSLLGSFKEETSELCASLKLTRKQRFYAFGICLCIGFGLSILGIILLGGHNLPGFAVCYTLGVFTSLLSSLFLWGPWYQLKNMFKETRVFATLAMLLFMGLTLTAALYWRKTGLTLIFCVCQFLAYTWYCLSYIPYARTIVKNCFENCFAG